MILKNSVDLFIQNLILFKQDDAIIFQEKTYSYKNLIERINVFYLKLTSLKVNSGDKLILISNYSFDSIALFFAAAKKHLIVIPITSNNEIEIQDRIIICGNCLIYDLRNNEIKNNQTEKKETDLIINFKGLERTSGLILFSSGSTGKPKAMLHNLDNLFESFLNKKNKKFTFLVFLMFDHIGGINTLLNSLAIGSKIVIPENRSPDHILNLINIYQINILPSSPTFLNLLLISGNLNMSNLNSLKLITYGTEPMPDSLLSKLKIQFPKVKFLQTFGTSETGVIKTISESSDSNFIKFDDSNQEYKIVQGELWIKSKTQILGYLNHTMDSFTDDGWFKTGDLVEEKGNNFLKIIGRSKQIINVGGEKVLPTEIESVILELDEILDCTAYGYNNIITGQVVAIKIQINELVDKGLIKKKIRLHCKDRLEKYKCPVVINFVEKNVINDRYKKVR